MLLAGLGNLKSPNGLHAATVLLSHAYSESADIASLRTKVLADATVQAWRGAIANPAPEQSNSLIYWMDSTVEKGHYRPFHNLLTAICEAVNTNCKSERYRSPISFSLYDREMQDRVGNNSSTKPVLLACEHAIRVGQRVSWNEVEGAVTAKDNWRDLFTEAATYGRALLTSRHCRRAAWIILLKHTTSEARVSFFHREGLTRTSPFQLTTSAGFDAFVCSVIGLILDQPRADTRVELPVPGDQNNLQGAHNICFRAAGNADNNADNNGTLDSPTYRRIITTTEGFPLRDAKGPRDLVEALLHAMIGYLNLLRRGWQHPNISNENVLLDKSFDIDECPSDEMGRFGLKPCRAILIDNGQAIEWKTEHEPAGHRLTLPFTSYAILYKWSQPEDHVHSGIDDLESFLWILIWEALHQGSSRSVLQRGDMERLQDLKVTSPRLLAHAKYTIISLFKDEPDTFDRSYLLSFVELLTQWCALAFSARKEMEALTASMGTDVASNLQKIEKLCFETGHKYIEIGFKHLNELSELWPGAPV
ncbi:hypothetical protein DFH06DRAFT_1295227 [Mycena polygramma]|nr:hypothetical protein DFH06DRAFT_1295227 [Mycena polygramma]